MERNVFVEQSTHAPAVLQANQSINSEIFGKFREFLTHLAGTQRSAHERDEVATNRKKDHEAVEVEGGSTGTRERNSQLKPFTLAGDHTRPWQNLVDCGYTPAISLR